MKRTMLLMLTPLALAGCVTNSVFAQKSDCSDLVEGVWEEPVPDPPAPMRGPTDLDTLKSWIGFAGQAIAAKRTEFERKEALRGIIERCEARDRAAIEDARPRFLGIF